MAGLSQAEAIQLASTAFAAIAAVGSAAAAWVMYRQWTISNVPALTVDLAHWQPRNVLALTIVNYGAPVKKVSIAVIEGDQACFAFLPPNGFLGRGERVQLTLGLDPSGGLSMTAVAYGFALNGSRVFAWAASGEEGNWPARSRGLFRRRPTDLTAAAILHRFYPNAPDPISLEKRGIVRHEVS